MKPVHLLMVAALIAVGVLAYFFLQSDDGARQGVRGGAEARRDTTRVESGAETNDDAGEPAATTSLARGELSVFVAVLAVDGSPAGGATLTVRDPLGDTAAITADDEGKAELAQVAAGHYAIQARLGNAVGSLNFELSDRTGEQTIQLHTALTVRGHVFDASNAAIRGATVSAVRAEDAMNRIDFSRIFRRIGEPDDLAATTRTDAEGAYELLLPGAGTYALSASSARHGQEYEAARPIVTDLEDADFHLFPAAFVEGRVVDVEGRPVPGAHLFLADMMSVFSGSAPKVEGIADDKGRFLLAATPGMGGSQMGSVILTARAPGYAARIHQGFPIPSSGIELVLERGVTLKMRTMDASMPGRPAPRVTVAAIFGQGFARGESDENGYVVIENLPTGSQGRERQKMALLTSKEFVPQMKQLADFEVEDGVLDVGVVPMERGGIVRGTARNKQTNEPVSGAIVQALGGLEQQLAMMGGSIARSDEEGKFELRGVPLKANALLGRHPDYILDPGAMPSLFRGMSSNAPPGGMFPDGETEIEQDVMLTPGAVVRGIVTSPAGEPVAGAKVAVEADQSMMIMIMLGGGPPSTFTAADGTFALKPVAQGTKVKLVATHRDFGPSDAREIDPGSEAKLVLNAPAEVVGVVRDQAGEPVQGARVEFTAKGGGGRNRMMPGMASASATRPGVTDDKGKFVIRNAPRGEGQLEYIHPHFLARSDPVQLGGGEQHDVGVVTLERGMTILGGVVDDEGKPVVGARVELRAERNENPGNSRNFRGYMQDQTDAEGKFGFFGLEAGAFTIRVTQQGLYAAPKPAEAGSEGHRIEMIEAAELRGIVRVEGKPVSGAQVHARMEGDLTSWAVTGADGRFTLGQLPPGQPFRLSIRHQEYQELEREGVVATAGEQSFDLKVGRAIEGVVVDGNNQPVEGAMVRVSPPWRSGVSGPDGRFRVTGLHEGELTVQLMESGKGFITGDAIKLAAGESSVRLVAIPGLSITGKVLGADGKPTMSVSIVALSADGKQVAQTWVSSAEGLFEMGGVPPGTYTLKVSRWQRAGDGEEVRPIEVSLENVAAGATDVVIRFEE